MRIPLNSGWSRWNANFDSRKKTYSRIRGPYPVNPESATRNHCAVSRRWWRTSNTLSSNPSHQTIHPIHMLLPFANHSRMSFLQDLVYRDKGLERLDFVGKDRLSRSLSATPTPTPTPINHPRTLSYQPRRPQRIYDPMCRRYNCEHVSLR